jgi:hypothetical protein
MVDTINKSQPPEINEDDWLNRYKKVAKIASENIKRKHLIIKAFQTAVKETLYIYQDEKTNSFVAEFTVRYLVFLKGMGLVKFDNLTVFLQGCGFADVKVTEMVREILLWCEKNQQQGTEQDQKEGWQG